MSDYVQDAFKSIKNLVPEDDQEALYSALAQVWSETTRETREEIAAWLDTMSEGRMDYVGAEPTHAGEVEALGGIRGSVYGEASGARWLAKILRRELDDKGWLPSWRWT